MNTVFVSVALIGVVTASAFGQARIVQGQIVDRRSPEWTIFGEQAEVVSTLGRNLVVRTFTESDVVVDNQGGGSRSNMRLSPVYKHQKTYHQTFTVTNFPNAGRYKIGDVIHPPIVAMRVVAESPSRTGYGSAKYELYDCGVEYVAPARKLTPQETSAAKAQEEKKKESGAAATFRFHQDRALAGNVGSQLRLGQLYLDGNGCQRDTNQAKIWLKKAADQGNEEAAVVLRRLAN